MNEFEALLLGVVQGLSEFLPISSSGHLVIAETLLGLERSGVVFEIAVHLGTLLSVLLFYRWRVIGLGLGVLRGDAASLRYIAKLAVATLPAVVAVLCVGSWLESLFDFPVITGGALLVTGGVLWTTRTTLPAARGEEPSWSAAFWIGCAQAAAIVPGISRSGATVATALAFGVRARPAAEFSFLMSVPAILGAALMKLSVLTAPEPSLAAAMIAGSTAAALSGLVAIWLFVKLLGTPSFHRFAYYTWTAGALFLLWLALA